MNTYGNSNTKSKSQQNFHKKDQISLNRGLSLSSKSHKACDFLEDLTLSFEKTHAFQVLGLSYSAALVGAVKEVKRALYLRRFGKNSLLFNKIDPWITKAIYRPIHPLSLFDIRRWSNHLLIPQLLETGDPAQLLDQGNRDLLSSHLAPVEGTVFSMTVYEA